MICALIFFRRRRIFFHKKIKINGRHVLIQISYEKESIIQLIKLSYKNKLWEGEMYSTKTINFIIIFYLVVKLSQIS